jgi:hypothetical protein
MSSPWYEPGYQPTALTCDMHYTTVTQTNLDNVVDCSVPEDCLKADIGPHEQANNPANNTDYSLLVERRSLHCYGLRQCGVKVDIGALETAVWQASQSVRILKRNMEGCRQAAFSVVDCASASDFLGVPATDGQCYDELRDRFYKKSYDNHPLQ